MVPVLVRYNPPLLIHWSECIVTWRMVRLCLLSDGAFSHPREWTGALGPYTNVGFGFSSCKECLKEERNGRFHQAKLACSVDCRHYIYCSQQKWSVYIMLSRSYLSLPATCCNNHKNWIEVYLTALNKEHRVMMHQSDIKASIPTQRNSRIKVDVPLNICSIVLHSNDAFSL